MPTATPDSAFQNSCFVLLSHKKGVGVCSPAHPGITGSRIAHITQDKQRQLAHASTDYINTMYIDTYYADASVVICLL